MLGLSKSTTTSASRRAEIRKNRPDAGESLVKRLRAEGGLVSLGVAAAFCLCTMLILVMREDVVRYRPGQWARHDIVARVDFTYRDEKLLAAARQNARDNTLRIYKPAEQDPWKAAEKELLALPDRVKGMSVEELPGDLRPVLDAGALSKLQEYQVPPEREKYDQSVRDYIREVQALKLVILPEDQRQEDLDRQIRMGGSDAPPIQTVITFTPKMREDIRARLNTPARNHFYLTLQPKVVELTLKHLGPTHVLDDAATAAARNAAAERVPASIGEVVKEANQTIVDVEHAGGEIRQEDWLVLRDENAAYLRNLGSGARWGQRAGLAGIVLLMTVAVCAYVARYQQRIVRNHARAVAIAVLLLSMLLLAQLAALGSSSIYFFGIAPTILVATILAIAYDQRFALGLATFHAVLVILALNVDLSFMTIIEAGVVTCCFLLDDLRTRSKLIEVGGATALAMICATGAAGLVHFDPLQYVARNCLYAGAAGLAVGFVVLGILPFIEKTFRITTSMTLLELADASQPLLRRLSLEAPGTYNHSLQVATLAEEAAEAIRANALLCRVAAYYHDIGKINKAEYFVENQTDGTNRHINLTPSVSLLIIIGHVKDGIELAREYNLPTSLFPFIQQHHGTTVVEYFYQRACDARPPEQQQQVDQTQYRYPGPKPKTREIAILMLADAVEGATRAMREPTASRIETLVHEIALRRLHDGQFDECDLTMKDLERIERSLVKTLLGVYHGRIAYPSTTGVSGTATTVTPVTPTAAPAAKTA
jgi:putative nucleotidyltransferase with HDIG domain